VYLCVRIPVWMKSVFAFACRVRVRVFTSTALVHTYVYVYCCSHLVSDSEMMYPRIRTGSEHHQHHVRVRIPVCRRHLRLEHFHTRPHPCGLGEEENFDDILH
jgi:hypothetical protein